MVGQRYVVHFRHIKLTLFVTCLMYSHIYLGKRSKTVCLAKGDEYTHARHINGNESRAVSRDLPGYSAKVVSL